MRKKYLSALLFGALLFASAGTFTSCKDYDDDIDNLQSQIDKVVSDLASLKSTVDNLNVGVTSVTVDGDQLVVVTNGATTKMNLPVGVQVSEIEIKDGHLYVGGVDKGAIDAPATPTEKAQKVEVKEDGFLYIDDVKQEGLHVGTDVVIKDASNGIYTITIGKETIQLPMASTQLQVTVGTNGFINDNGANNGIAWGFSNNEITWGGALGNTVANQLLVGTLPTATINVLPASYDLSAQTLTLVNSLGENAPVVVSAEAAEGAVSTPRATTPGAWKLSIKLDSSVSKDNMGSVFTDGNDNNYKYALAVNGSVCTGYEFIIDTRKNKTTTRLAYTDLKFGGQTGVASGALISTALTADLGSTEIAITDAVTGKSKEIVDAYIELTNKNQYEAWGISAKGMTVTASEKAAGKTTTATIHVLDVTGKELKQQVKLTFGYVAVDKVALPDQTITMTPDAAAKGVMVNLSDLFTSLSATEAEDINGNIKWTVKDGKTYADNTTAAGISSIAYYSENEAKSDYLLNPGVASDITKIKYALIPAAALKGTAETGDNTFTITLTDGNNEIKKATAKVTVKAPAFDDLFTRSAAWEGSAVTMIVPNLASPSMDFSATLNRTDMLSSSRFVLADLTAVFDMIGSNSTAPATLTNTGQLKTNTASTGLLDNGTYKSITGKVSYKITGNIKAESEKITVNFKSALQGSTLAYYEAGAASNITITSAANKVIAPFALGTGFGSGKTASGLSLEKGDSHQALANSLGTVTAKLDAKAGSAARATPNAAGQITISGVVNGTYETVMTVTIEEASKIVTTVTIPVSVNF